jgi:serine phosphatase RsbU (regulator of sigma subunit)
MPTLVFLNGPRAGIRLPVVGNRFLIGRATGCDVVIGRATEWDAGTGAVPGGADGALGSISRRHALVICIEGRWYIEDGDGQGRQSRNGTFVNDERVPFPQRVPLRHDDRIRICNVRLAFQQDPESTVLVEAAVGRADSHLALSDQPADRLSVLLALSAALRNNPDPDEVLDRTLEHLLLLFPQADRGVVVVREDPTGSLAVRARHGPCETPPEPWFSSAALRRCMEKLEAVLGTDVRRPVPGSARAGARPVRWLMCAPLWTDEGHAFGAVQLDAGTDGRNFTTDDLHLLLGVASQASIALASAQWHRAALALQERTRTLEAAQQVQRAMLPRELPNVRGYEFFAHYEAAQEVGGDYYDFLPLPGGRWAVLLGDVAGKGVAAALVMAKFGVEARVCLESEADPTVAVNRLNALMARGGVPEKFVTLAAVVLDPSAHRAVVVDAGHPSPLLLRAGGTVEETTPEEAAGLPIGIDGGYQYESRTVALAPGDRLLLFSDGVSDSMDVGDRRFGTAAIRATVGVPFRPQATGQLLLRAVQRHAAGCEQNDDITVVCFGRVLD